MSKHKKLFTKFVFALMVVIVTFFVFRATVPHHDRISFKVKAQHNECKAEAHLLTTQDPEWKCSRSDHMPSVEMLIESKKNKVPILLCLCPPGS